MQKNLIIFSFSIKKKILKLLSNKYLEIIN